MNPSITDLDNPQGYKRLLGGVHLPFSARAWEGYIHYGRGALVVRMSEVKELQNSPGLYAISAKYVSEDSKQLAGFPQMAHILKEYDPEREVIIVFVSLSGNSACFSWHVPEDLLPPRAYEVYRSKHPIGVRLNVNMTLEESLRLFTEHELSQKRKREAQRERILSDTAHQVSYLKVHIEEQERLRKELEAGGIGIDHNGHAYPIEKPSSPPKDSFERLYLHVKIIDYLAATTALNRAVQIYGAGKARGEQYFKEAAEAALTTYEDKVTVIGLGLSAGLAEEDSLAEDTEEMRKIFLIIIAARLRANIKRFPRIQQVLEAEAKAEGKTVEEVLLSKILSGMFLAWAEYEVEPHQPFINDSNTLVNKITNFIIHDAKPQMEETRDSELLNDLEQVADPYATDFARQLESDDEYTAWLNRAGLTAAENEVVTLKLQDLTEEEIAKQSGRKVGTVKSLWSRARQRLADARKQ